MYATKGHIWFNWPSDLALSQSIRVSEFDVGISLQWRHNKRNDVSNQQRLDCLLNRLFRRRSKKTSKLRVTGLCEGNSPVTGEFHSQKASNTENVSIWWPWRHHLHSGVHRYPVFPPSYIPWYLHWSLVQVSHHVMQYHATLFWRTALMLNVFCTVVWPVWSFAISHFRLRWSLCIQSILENYYNGSPRDVMLRLHFTFYASWFPE